jgi:AraC-like DNA-binding protein
MTTHREATVRTREALFHAAVAVIERDAHDSGLWLEGVADELAVSPRHLQRVFREVGGTTYRRCVDGIRMERAAVMLREELPKRGVPVRPVREVAAMVGYSQPAGFAKAYRRYTGRNPHEERGRGD